MLEKRKIRPSKSEWTAPLVFVRKRNGALRVCVDYKDLNNASIKDVYTMPNIDDVIYRLYLLEIASTFDLVEGYNQVEMLGAQILFEPNFMTFGLTNAPIIYINGKKKFIRYRLFK